MIETTIQAVEQEFRAFGFSYRVAGIEILDNLDETFAMLRERRLVSESLLGEYDRSLRFEPPAQVPEVRSLVVVATPSPPVKVRFHLNTGPFEAVIPPTYISSGLRARCLDVLQEALAPEGFSVARVPVPVKLLAVRTGLAEYGRNNIAYTRTLGSFVRLDTFATDADLVSPGGPRAGLSTFLVGGRDPTSGRWSPPRRMGSCGACKACYHVCPTGCIPFPDTGVVIDAERCLTYLNEHESEWPDRLDPAAHNALIGCMRCQLICPANKYHLRREKVVAEFDREETEIVLKDLPSEELPEPVRSKLALLDLDDYSTVLGRNLRALAG
jgi:epoxyqueuosine reductase